MNVFVETNFVIEVALEQQEAPSCETLIQLATQRRIRLLVPAYSFVEPHETFTRRRMDREALRARVASELAQLARSTPLAERVGAAEDIVKLLADSTDYETMRLGQVKQRLWAAAEVLPLDAAVLRSAAERQRRFDLSAQDAVVYASIRARLEVDHAADSCFVSRNPGDFDDPALHQDLASFRCRYLSSFTTAVQYITHTLHAAPGAE